MQTIQICVAGSFGAGKSSLLRRYIQNKYDQNAVIPTVGVNHFFSKATINNKQYKIELMDTQAFDPVRTSIFLIPMYKQYKGFLIVYDITSYESFVNVKSCYKQIKQHVQPQNQNIYIIGNKVDLKQNRPVSAQQAMKYCLQIDVEYAETSAKNDNDIVKLINRVAKNLAKDHIFKKGQPIKNQKPNIILTKEVNKKNYYVKKVLH